MIGIVCAMQSEAQKIVEQLSDCVVYNYATKEFCVGKLFGQEVVVCTCGIGKVNSAIGTVLCVEKFAADLIVNFGVVGAIDNTLRIGDVVVGNTAMQYDFDLSVPNGLLVGQLPNFDSNHIPLAQKYVKAFKDKGYKIGGVATIDAFKYDPNNLQFCIKNNLAVEDMEGGAIAQVCTFYGVDFVSIKSVSNMVDPVGAQTFNEQEENAVCNYINQLQDIMQTVYDVYTLANK